MLVDPPRFKALRAARDAIRADPAARKALADYQTHVDHLQQLQAARKPIEVADKRRLAELETALSGNAKVMAMSKAQADFSELMSRINRAIYEKIAAEDADEEEAPPAKQ
jgi:cell fate (sporulation/competence/biofilm development) regulator YlbF (YheA/YmcA/DUF963 family)